MLLDGDLKLKALITFITGKCITKENADTNNEVKCPIL